MQKYEITYLLTPELNETEIAEKESLISNTQQKTTKKITLAYPIKKTKTAFLGCQEIKTDPDKIKEMKKALDKEEAILRFLITKKTEEKKSLSSEGTTEKTTKKPKEKTADIDQELEKILNT